MLPTDSVFLKAHKESCLLEMVGNGSQFDIFLMYCSAPPVTCSECSDALRDIITSAKNTLDSAPTNLVCGNFFYCNCCCLFHDV
ncbi:Pheromone-processing carboxypeptidase KEX1 [Labeo rohita]|uniref:Pheromone-processing carboxypeptidase KEX1 n=1 Tax=Labeo rohita TaxID=84645 RepID=A0ABQ8MIR7_LABRO|nr:Pheromone-processing carboxypeptidase KEX1 [Labeo rohita]